MGTLLSLLFAPPRLLVRALDDLNRIADSAEAIAKATRPLEEDIDGLRRAFEGSNDQLAKIRKAFTPQFAALHAELLSLRAQVGSEIAGIDRNLTEVAETVEPLQGAAERIGRAVERVPGPGRRKLR